MNTATIKRQATKGIDSIEMEQPLRRVLIRVALSVFMFAFLSMTFEAHAAARVALVIGNSNYQHAKLRNTLNDANDMAVTLEAMGFDVILRTDVNRKQMRQAMREYRAKLSQDSVGLFYFSGHGVQVGGENYLVPLGTNIETEDEVPDESVSASSVLRKIESAENRLNIVILDACRNNPFARSFRSAKSGLARIDAPLGSIVAYSTAPGSVAADGRGRNGTYTKHLLSAIKAPGLSIEQVFKRVRNSVIDATSGKQVPWEETSLRDDFFFSEGKISDNYSATVASVAPVANVEPEQQVITSSLEPAVQSDRKPTEVAFRDQLDDGFTGPWMIPIESGEFEMGGKYYNEQPVHPVSIDSAFAIMAYEVTENDYKAFADETGRSFSPNSGRSPVANVSWFDAREYAAWLSKKTGEVYRLPSESEWEFVARGGRVGSEEATRDLGNLAVNCKDCTEKWSDSRSVAVHSLSRELVGTRGMLGNVWEWVEDCWVETYDPGRNSAAPRSIPNCSNKALRGGSWNYIQRYSTPSARMGVSAYTKAAYIGFRLVRESLGPQTLVKE